MIIKSFSKKYNLRLLEEKLVVAPHFFLGKGFQS